MFISGSFQLPSYREEVWVFNHSRGDALRQLLHLDPDVSKECLALPDPILDDMAASIAFSGDELRI